MAYLGNSSNKPTLRAAVGVAVFLRAAVSLIVEAAGTAPRAHTSRSSLAVTDKLGITSDHIYSMRDESLGGVSAKISGRTINNTKMLSHKTLPEQHHGTPNTM